MRELAKASDYRSEKSYAFPDEDKLSQGQRKLPTYFLASANAIVTRYVNNRCSLPYDTISGRRTISELRLYRMGQNSPNKYKGYMCGWMNKEGGKLLGGEEGKKARKTTLNISWDVLQILPKKMDDVMGYLQKINYDTETSAIDYQALIGKKTMVAMAKIFADERMALLQNAANEASGRTPIQPTDPAEMPGGMQFNNPKEVDVAAAVGVFFLQQEAAIQTLLTKSAEESGSDSLNDLCKDDLITTSYAGKRIITNQNTNIVTEDYVDIDNAMFPYSTYLDYRDITWAGEIRSMTIAQLRKELKIDEEELIKIARMYASAHDNGSGASNFYFNVQRDRNNNDFGMNMMDQIQVDVADCRWLGLKGIDFTTVTREKEGNLAVNTVEDTYKLSERDKRKGKELYNYKNQTVYKAKLVLGTSYVFDYGEDNDIAFEKTPTGKMAPVFPYKFVRTGNVSLVERCIGFVDDANLSNYKLRVARMKMPAPPNLFIDKAALEGGVNIDGVSYKPHMLMRLLQDEGFLIGDTKNQWGQTNNNGKAVTPIGTDMISILMAWRQDREDNIMMIDKITGINDMFSAQTPQRTTAVGVANNLIQGTQNSLTPIIKADRVLFEGSKRIQVKKWQIVASYMTPEERKKLSINRALQTLEIGSDLNDFDFDIQIHAAITDQEKSELIQDIKDMRNLRRQVGSGGLNESDFMLLNAMVRSGKIVQAQLAMASIIEAREKADKAQQQQLVQQNAQVQQQSAQAAAQGEQQTNQQEKDLDLRNKLQEIEAKYKADSRLKAQQSLDDRRLVATQNIWGVKKKSA